VKRSSLRPAALALTLLSLGGCYDEMPNMRLLNATGGPVTLVTKAETDGERSRVLANGALTERLSAMGSGRQLKVIQKGCADAFLIPSMGVNYPFEGDQEKYPVVLQIAPDHRVYLLPPGATSPLPVTQLAAAQKGGFPLKPHFGVCSTEQR